MASKRKWMQTGSSVLAVVGIFGLAACSDDDGGTSPDGGMISMDECQGQADGTACTAPGTEGRTLCIAEACIVVHCGDGYVDAESGEECDDGNSEGGDGCEPGDCTYSCGENADCDDGNPCNGEETCGESSHRCAAGLPPEGVTACTQDDEDESPGVCRGSECVPEGCGDEIVDDAEECDDGNDESGDGCETDCTFTCVENEDCDDGNVCTGAETCVDHVCVAGEAVVCADDGNPCTDDTFCDPVDECTYPLIDLDGDGAASTELGECGTDCNDDDPTIRSNPDPNPDMVEFEACGDSVDNDCDGNTDETETTYYADCDGDGYSIVGANQRTQCTPPSTSAATTGCGHNNGSWQYLNNPNVEGKEDCKDDNAQVYPTAPAFHTSAIPGRPGDYDWNCDGTEQLRYPCVDCDRFPCILCIQPVKCPCRSCPCAECGAWENGPVPTCGASAEFDYYDDDTLGRLCLPNGTKTQACR